MSPRDGVATRFLDRIERLGNRLPHPTLLFVWLCGVVLLLSALFAWLGVSAIHPVSGDSIRAINLIGVEGLHRILGESVSNFVQFAPVGTVLVAIMGIGVAERSGLIDVLLKASVLRAPPRLLTFLVVFLAVMSSIAVDSGYVVLIPLAGMLFHALGRNPIAGIAAAFAGVSGGFSANLLLGPIDAILAGLSTEAAALVSPGYVVNTAANYYFSAVSTVLVAVVVTVVTERVVIPRLGTLAADVEVELVDREISAAERRALRAVGLFTLATTVWLLWGLLPQQGFLREIGTGSLVNSPFINGIVTVIAVYAAIAGWLFGRISGRFQSSSEIITAMEASMATMASYLVLMFFAAQFVSYFGWSQLGLISAVRGAELLQTLNPGPAALMVGFVLFAALVNLMIGSAAAKWALLAPAFIPMLMIAGISPEATQMAYRVGDSTTNIITPLMPYFGVVVAFAQRYDRNIGIGTIIATMLPYSVWLLLSWSLLLVVWIVLEIPPGPGATIFSAG